ncbi:MAG TPA: aminotransferase class IV [Terriglobia bacterium]|nr:aminotransferase class IV [Terriglobia bacterium]
MSDVISVNGVITPAEEAVIPVLDHGFLFGDSVYETLRTHRHKPFLFTRHFRRMERSARSIELELPWSREETFSEVRRTTDAAGLSSESRIRITITRGVGKVGPDPASCKSPNVIIIVTPLVELPESVYEHGVDVVTSSLHRTLHLADAKTGNLIRTVLAQRESRMAGAFEAILLTPEGWISDGITSNVYLVKGRKVLTPSREANSLEGITQGTVLALARNSGLEVVEGLLHPREIAQADEMFLTSTTREVVPIVRVDGRPVASGAPGPVTLGLRAAYLQQLDALIQED